MLWVLISEGGRLSRETLSQNSSYATSTEQGGRGVRIVVLVMIVGVGEVVWGRVIDDARVRRGSLKVRGRK